MQRGEEMSSWFPEAGGLLTALRNDGLTIAVAESCTGGLLAAALTAFAGSSDVVRGGVVSYADDLKTALLGVSAETLRAHGAVSPEVARAMAAGARQRCGADMGVAITGIAGPGGGSPGKPVGLIYVAVVTAQREDVTRLEDDGGREANRARAVHAALELCARHASAGRSALR
jgi:PncC family amidohydrolase